MAYRCKDCNAYAPEPRHCAYCDGVDCIEDDADVWRRRAWSRFEELEKAKADVERLRGLLGEALPHVRHVTRFAMNPESKAEVARTLLAKLEAETK